jgi:endogenous inhibitor of DNA gyrase (YacG/DUF329 family)
MRCPICKSPVDPESHSRWFPFCSDRCKLIDLGRWLSGRYAIPVRPEEDDSDSPIPPPGQTPTGASDDDN